MAWKLKTMVQSHSGPKMVVFGANLFKIAIIYVVLPETYANIR